MAEKDRPNLSAKDGEQKPVVAMSFELEDLIAADLTTPSGRAFAGMLAVFAEFERDILRDRVKAGIAQARKEGKPHGRAQNRL